MEQKQVNKEYVIQSLMNQIAGLSMDRAERDSIITELYQEIDTLSSEIKECRDKEIEQMDSAE